MRSGADDAAVVLGDDHGGRPRGGDAVKGGPDATAALAGVLDVDKHRPLVRGGDDTGDLAVADPGEEPADLRDACGVGAVGVRGEHLVVGAGRLGAVGLDPDPAVG